MTTTHLSSTRRLSDSELVARVKDLACRERQATASLVAHLAEFDERRLYLAEGCSCLFKYCTEVLHLSEHAAYNRIKVARAVRKFPVIFERLANGSVHLTSVRLLAPVLTLKNHRDLLDQATHRSRQEVEKLVARLRPLPPVASTIRRLPVRRADTDRRGIEVAAALDFSQKTDGSLPPAASCLPQQPVSIPVTVAQADPISIAGNVAAGVPAGNSPSDSATPRRSKLAALAPDLYKVEFTADAESHRLLCQARELLRHQIPDGDAGAVIGMALKVLVDKLKRQKLGAGMSPQRRANRIPAGRSAGGHTETVTDRSPGTPSHTSRYIPAKIRHEVWNRDQGRCAFVSRNGIRCSERGQLEFHHTKPFACGGAATVENIQIRCRAHNSYEAEIYFGHRERPADMRSSLVPERVQI